MAFSHPGTTIPLHKFSVLRAIPSSIDKDVKDGFNRLMNEVNADMSVRSRAKREVRVVFDPSPFDLAEYPRDVQTRLINARDANDELIRRGVVAGHKQFTGDSIRIFKHTMAFLMTGRTRHARKAIELLLSWSNVCKVFGPKDQNGPLEAAWALVNMAQSAEILKYRFKAGWNSTVENRFNAFVDNLLMPNLVYYERNGLLIDFPSRSNWGTTIVQARLQYAIYRNNKNEYDKCLKMTRQLMTNVLTHRTGRTSETLRDVVHAQYALAGLTGLAELYYNQGLNVYRDRLMTAYEYHARILLGQIPLDLKGVQLNWVGFLPAHWEMIYNAFVNRLKRFKMPYTRQLLLKNRPENYDKHWGFGTFTHYIA